MKHKRARDSAFRMAFALFIASLPGLVVVGQSSQAREIAERARQRETGLSLLRDVVLKDAPSLRLVENRAYVYKSAATAVSRINRKESAELLERAILEVDTAVAAQATANAAPMYPMEGLRRVREEALLALSDLDPKRALTALRSRKGGAEIDGRLTPADRDLEWRILQRAAATDPSLVLESAMKGLGSSLAPCLVETYIALRETSPELGQQLGRAIVERLNRENPDPHSSAAQTAFALMADLWSRGQPTALDTSSLGEDSIRQLVTFVADLLLAEQNSVPAFTGDVTSFASIVGKYDPSRAAQLRSRLANLSARAAFGPPDMKELEALLQAGNYEQATDWSRNAPVEARRYAFRRIAEAQVENGEFSLARNFIRSQITDIQTREELLGRLTTVQAEAAAGKGDEALTRGLIPLLPSDNERLSTLLALARKAAANGNTEKASAILEEARALPYDKSERLRNEIIIAGEFVSIDAAKSVEIMAAHIQRLNELLEASAVLDGYFGPESIHEGEILYLSSSPLLPAVTAVCDILGKIGAIDSDQAQRLARRIAGRELQTLAILTISEHLILGPGYTPHAIKSPSVRAKTRSIEREKEGGRL